MKMKGALTSFRLDKIPELLEVVKAVIASGFFIAVTGGTGFSAACYEVLWLIYVHLGGLGIIITMEFALGITLMVVKSTIEHFMESEECGKFCGLTLQAVVLNLAIPAAGLMVTIIIMQALMVYSAMQLYYYLKDKSESTPAPTGPIVVVQNMQMQNVESQSPQPMYTPSEPMYASPNVEYGPYQPHLEYVPAHQQPYATATWQPHAAQPQPVHFPDEQYIDPPPYAEVGLHVVQLPGQEGTIVQQAVSPHTAPQLVEPQSVPIIQLPDVSKRC